MGTRTAGFIGRAPNIASNPHTAVSINSWADFKQQFITSADSTVHSSSDLSHAVHGFFLNGGSRCYVVNIAAETSITNGLAELAKIGESASQ